MDQNNAPQDQSESQAPAPAPMQPAAPVAMPAQGTGSGFAVAALVLGIIAFLFSWMSLFNLPASILAVVFGIVSLNKHQSKGMGLTGLILGGIGLIASIAWFVFALIVSSNS